MKAHLLWADDDCNRLLMPLGRIIERNGHLILAKATSYVTAMSKLNESHLTNNTRIDSLLVDIILPYAEGSGALASDLGLMLAERSITMGVKRIAFLTVVRLDEVIDKYNELVAKNPDVRFTYYDKTTLLEHKEIDNMIEHLSSLNEGK